MALHMPDFRAGERTFQLLVQVAGRAGRGDVEGEVIVQSFTPFHAAIQFAKQHDYVGFYDQEIEFREQLRYPPATRMVCINLRAKTEEKAIFFAAALARELRRHITGNDILSDPTPAPLAKVQNQYRYQIIARSSQILRLTEAVAKTVAGTKLPDDVTIAVDVDPVSLL